LLGSTVGSRSVVRSARRRLLAYWTFLSLFLLSIVQSACRRLLVSVVVVVETHSLFLHIAAGSTGLSVLLFDSFGSLAVNRSVGVSPLTSIGCCGDSLLLFVPVSTGLPVLLFLSVLVTLVWCISESRGLPCSHFVMLERTSSFGTSFR
jgi:hypothetical protein